VIDDPGVPGVGARRQGSLSSPSAGALYGLAAALTFGASAPLSKLLLDDVEPVMLASLLYLGAGVALTIALAARARTREADLSGADVPALLLLVVTGGVVAPILMLMGLQRVSGVAGALLLNLEAPFTMLLAVAVFGEHLGRRDVPAVGAILAGGLLLAVSPGAVAGEALGVLLLASACACWAVDNNVTQRLALKDPLKVVRIKTLAAGTGTLVIAMAVGAALPSAGTIAAALGLGAISYGVSIVLDAYALRLVGAAREAAFFATAPFFGAALALPLLGERFDTGDLIAGLLMAVGVTMLLRSRHGHRHAHDSLVHEHLHEHDEHHRHQHDGPVSPGVRHSHVHTHEPLVHDHPHVSDAHHRHQHSK
jgi:drug/metabolite transporter (DMT)-like permease